MEISATPKGRFRTLLLATLCQSTQAIAIAGLPLLLPMMRQDMGLTFAQGGSLAAASILIYALMQIPAGYLADRYQPRKMVVIGTIGIMSLSLMLSFSRQYWQVLIIQFFWGFFSSFVFIPGMSLFINWFSAQRRATATVLPMLGVNIGILVINLLFPMIVNRYDTWRTPFLLFAVAGFIFALALLLLGKDTLAKGATPKFEIAAIREIFQYKPIWLCYSLQFIRFGISQGIIYWLPSLLINEKLFPLQLAGLVIASQSVFGAPSNIFGAYISDKFKKPTLIIGVSMVALGISTGLLVILNSIGLIMVVIIINAIFNQMYFGPLFAIASDILGPGKTGVSNGIGNTFANFGGLASAFLMGVLKDITGSFEWGFYLICGISAVGLILTVILEKTRRRLYS